MLRRPAPAEAARRQAERTPPPPGPCARPHLIERHVLRPGDVVHDARRLLDPHLQQRAARRRKRCLARAVLPGCAALAHEAAARVAHDRAHVRKVDVHEAGHRDDVADAAHAAAQYVVRDLEGLRQGQVGVHSCGRVRGAGAGQGCAQGRGDRAVPPVGRQVRVSSGAIWAVGLMRSAAHSATLRSSPGHRPAPAGPLPCSRRSLGMTMSVSTAAWRLASASRAWFSRWRPSNVKGTVTMPTVRMPCARAAAATTGAAPLPVPPPMPACKGARGEGPIGACVS
jgi:hypothetical protein